MSQTEAKFHITPKISYSDVYRLSHRGKRANYRGSELTSAIAASIITNAKELMSDTDVPVEEIVDHYKVPLRNAVDGMPATTIHGAAAVAAELAPEYARDAAELRFGLEAPYFVIRSAGFLLQCTRRAIDEAIISYSDLAQGESQPDGETVDLALAPQAEFIQRYIGYEAVIGAVRQEYIASCTAQSG